MSSTPSRPSTAARGGSIVVVQVGYENVNYLVHKALLIEHSDYFKQALSGPWKEAQECVVRLDDLDCAVFEIFVDWLYTGTLPKEDSAWDDLSLKTDLAKVTEQTMVKVCALADRLLATSFSQAVEHKVISYFLSNEYEDAPPFYNTIILAFEILPQRSSILTLLVDLHCENYLEQHDSRNEGELPLRDQLPQEFLIRTMLRYSKILSSPPSRILNACDYHGHGSYEEREACQDNEDARLRERVAAIRKRIDALRIR